MSTDATACAVCGGPFSSKRVWIDGAQQHERCSYESSPLHRLEDMARMTAEIEKLLSENRDLHLELALLKTAKATVADPQSEPK